MPPTEGFDLVAISSFSAQIFEAYAVADHYRRQGVPVVMGGLHVSMLPEEALQHCDGNFIIPQVGMVQSLNISVACAVSLYEAFRQRNEKGYYNKVRLPEGQYQSLAEKWGMQEGRAAGDQ